jgi:hypothetical protein
MIRALKSWIMVRPVTRIIFGLVAILWGAGLIAAMLGDFRARTWPFSAGVTILTGIVFLPIAWLACRGVDRAVRRARPDDQRFS